MRACVNFPGYFIPRVLGRKRYPFYQPKVAQMVQAGIARLMNVDSTPEQPCRCCSKETRGTGNVWNFHLRTDVQKERLTDRFGSVGRVQKVASCTSLLERKGKLERWIWQTTGGVGEGRGAVIGLAVLS